MTTLPKGDYQQVVSLFLLEAKHRSPHTERAYRQTLTRFQQWIEESSSLRLSHLEQIDASLLSTWRHHLTKSPVAGQNKTRRTSTVWHHVRVVGSLLTFARRRGFLPKSHDPMAELDRPRSGQLQPERPTRPLTEAEVGQLLSYLDGEVESTSLYPLSKAHATAVLWATIVCVFLTTGIRRSELCQLTMADAFWEGDVAMLKLTLKGGKPHTIAILPETLKAIDAYRRAFRAEADASDPLFVAASHPVSRRKVVGTPLHVNAVSSKMRLIGERAGISKRLTPHVFRATAACTLWKRGIAIHRIQALLGHGSPQMTWLYLSRMAQLECSAALELSYVT